MGGPWRQTSLSLDYEHLDTVGFRPLERQRLAHSGGKSVPRWSRVPLEEKCLALHLRVPGQAAVTTELCQILPGEGKLRITRQLVLLLTGLLVFDAKRFIENRKGRIDKRNRVACTENKTIAESLLRMTDIPSHFSAEQQRYERVDL